MRGGRPPLALLAIPLFALAWWRRETLLGEGAAVLLSALSCVTLGVLLAAVAPRGWLKVGIVAMAAVDAYLVGSSLLQPANDVLNAAAPPAHLPQLQRALFGDALIGYGDLFVAGVFGAIVAAEQRDGPHPPAIAPRGAGRSSCSRSRPPSTCCSSPSTCCRRRCRWRSRCCCASGCAGASGAEKRPLGRNYAPLLRCLSGTSGGLSTHPRRRRPAIPDARRCCDCSPTSA